MIKVYICGHLIDWKADEDFTELMNFGPIPINLTTAVEIEKLNLSIRSKILLSAVAGAAIQYMIDCHPSENWMSGELIIENTEVTKDKAMECICKLMLYPETSVEELCDELELDLLEHDKHRLKQIKFHPWIGYAILSSSNNTFEVSKDEVLKCLRKFGTGLEKDVFDKRVDCIFNAHD